MVEPLTASHARGGSGSGTEMAIGADLGGTKLSVVLLDSARAVVHSIWVEHAGESISDQIAALETAVAECKAVAARADGEVCALGLGVAGWLSRDREHLVWAANLGSRDRQLGPELRQRFGLPVVIDNDGNAAAVAEHRARGNPDCMVLFVLGTGVGGGVVVDGKPVLGARGLAGELGHLPVDPGGAECVCGGRGCLELVASGPGIARAGQAATSFEVVAAANDGDAAARSVLAAAGAAIGRAVALLVPVIDPDLVLVGGRLAQAAADYLIPSARSALEAERPLRKVRPAPVVEISRLGPESGAIGAAQLALDAVVARQAKPGPAPRGIAAGGGAMSPDPLSPGRVLRFGVVGAGRIAQVAHLPAMSKADRAQLVAICDTSSVLAGQVAQRYGAIACTQLTELLEHDLDAVLVATPDRSHLPVAAAALRAGKHVLVEKPLAGTSAEAAELSRLADEAGLKLQVGAMKRHDPGIEYARAALAGLGPVLSAQAWYRVMSALRPPTEATLFPRTVVDDDVRQAESVHKADREHYLLNTHGAHVFDGIRYLIGELSSIRAEVAHVGKDYTWHGTGRLAASGGLASFEISANVHAHWAEGMDIYGERGHLRVRSFFPFFRRASDVMVFTEGDSLTVSPAFGDTDPYERQLEAFASAVLDDQPTNPSGADGVAAVRLIEAVRASASQGGTEVTL